LIGISVCTEKIDGHPAVTVDAHDDRTGARVTFTLRKRGASVLVACLRAAVDDPDADWETDFRIHGEISR
jgi:hypothetical protein